ncbi:probable NADH dehydrogenase [ubiquinone] 1 alpha subcomplex subunit 12 [Neodiprion pinetum]|uniref:NADH dehydrogenase [ubiquinone] 1 alpha subcomplex subunit 12 n=1 Tax=Neodiprion lecontei TaxID=441921 RepID=A0A6J0CA89_NEOLC|nr:probable NADH dehydrogenase [ubiquinone] 1 alpha subcomplex subunit 12 [Neodiprion lecontei]XP_046420900.1 probable NADH dehydrogenase [ubiquinone] 1 alpha subcomplex subunit 12 [Neodiprion fabricii]XP_046480743.1 probable NADH dehydrogenase [ubiquinone] 1 alpha subcomplex subunit 12 [Neodiprion pinetum]XP_046614785.1 probable NADH dehydrogenase [ubiquinone] 1 alpha subcomplex subunit 12 [Neodiprion virginianus]
MAKFFGVDKVVRFFQIVRDNGGIRGSLRALYRRDELKSGTLIGEDKYGNRYFENNMHFYGRNRWVEYADHVGLDYNASQVPPEWFGWLHYKTDLPPYKDPSRPNYKWMLDHTENMTGTRDAYMPYSTTRPKIEAWKPK